MHPTLGKSFTASPQLKLYFESIEPFSGYINLRKVKWDAKHEYDFVHNFKVLQATFKLLAVDKVRTVTLLIVIIRIHS